MKKTYIIVMIIALIIPLLLSGCAPADPFEENVYLSNLYVWDGVTWVEVDSGAADEFTDLGDVPGSYVGEAGKFVSVDPGETGLVFTDGVSVIWHGAYDGGHSYIINDAVSYLGSSYICILASTGNLPTDITFWDILASKGDAGAAGPANVTAGRKPGNEIVNNSNVMQPDDFFTWTLEAGHTYELRMWLTIISQATPDFKYWFNATNDCDARWEDTPAMGVASTYQAMPYKSHSNGDTSRIDGTGGYQVFFIVAGLFGISGGTVTFEWAQNTANVSDTQVDNVSYYILTNITG